MLTVHQCNNCGQHFGEEELRPIRHLTERVSPGEEMPSGECPNSDCGALCHPESIGLKDALTILFDRLDGTHEDPTQLCVTPSTPAEHRDALLISQALRWVESTKNEQS